MYVASMFGCLLLHSTGCVHLGDMLTGASHGLVRGCPRGGGGGGCR